MHKILDFGGQIKKLTDQKNPFFFFFWESTKKKKLLKYIFLYYIKFILNIGLDLKEMQD